MRRIRPLQRLCQEEEDRSLEDLSSGPQEAPAPISDYPVTTERDEPIHDGPVCPGRQTHRHGGRPAAFIRGSGSIAPRNSRSRRARDGCLNPAPSPRGGRNLLSILPAPMFRS